MTIEADAVVVGSGIAGMSAAIAAAEEGVEVVLVTDRAVGRSNSIMAQGGIQVPAEESDAELMLRDMMSVGGPEIDLTKARAFVSELPRVAEQLAAWGLEFDHDDSGRLVRRLAGGLSSPRILTVGDEIGRPLTRLLRDRVMNSCNVVAQLPVVAVEPQGDAFRLISSGGDAPNEEILARTVVIATGGTAYQEAVDTGQLTSNPPNENGRLRSSLGRLGLTESNPRLFQWHPFGLPESVKGSTVECVPESVAALGPRLVTADAREVCRLPAPRSVVVNAMRRIHDEPDSPGIRLTVSDLPATDLARFPKVRKQMESYGEDPVVTPVLHYELSGLEAGPDQSTPVPGLFLAGEIVGGIHGRERLMGSGVGDSLVHGQRAGANAARLVKAG